MSLSRADEVVVITDTSCLIILEKIGMLDLLHQLFSTVLTTPEIAGEFGGIMPEWIVVTPVKNELFKKELSGIVDIGEASAIALAHEVTYNYLVTDDKEARNLAIKLGLPIIGSLGVLIRVKQAELIVSIKPFIELMKTTNFRVSEDLYQIALRKANEL